MSEKKKKTINGKVATDSVRSFLGGAFLLNRKTVKQLPFLLFLASLGIVYIANSYYSEKNIRRTDKLQRELKELRYEYISVKSQLMQMQRQSQIAGMLAKKGIKESLVPPTKIFIKNDGDN